MSPTQADSTVTELSFALTVAADVPAGKSAERLAAFREHVDSGVRGMFAPKAFVGYTLQGEGSNLDGFCDRDWDASKPPGVIRIACLGGSTTQDGCMTDRTNTYSSFLSRMMNRRLQADVEVLNFFICQPDN